ncbi:coiled-coil domain-containing protein 83 [Rhinophrynus dorsalis]
MGNKEKKVKKKKKGSKSSSAENKMTFSEILLAHQIEMKEKTVEELLAELKQVEEKNARYKERNERLKAEQEGHIKTLLKEAKAQEMELAKKGVVNREQVEAAIKDKQEYVQEKQHFLEEICREINQLEKQTVEKERERDYWLEYKDIWSKEHARQIDALKAETNTEQQFSEINDYFTKYLEMTKTDLNVQAEKIIKEKKEMAALDAMNNIDINSWRAIKENEWLKKEIAVYKKNIISLEEAFNRIEQENLKLISQLSDVKPTRNLFLTQVDGLQVPSDGLHEDLANLELNIKRGPETATLAAPEKKVFSMDLIKDESQQHLSFSHEDEKDIQGNLPLDPLQRKLLSIEGRSLEIHREEKEKKTELMDDSSTHKRPKWPISPRMLKSILY